MILLQTAALFRDAYRELNARKLFWLSMILSGVVVLSFSLVGFEDGFLKIFIWKTPFALEAMGMERGTFYKFVFLNFGVTFWLAWATTIIAIVTTASIIPDFISGGAIDLALSKPIGRVRLFLTKYAAAMIFVALQVTVFAVLSFFVLGLRGQTWEPVVFLTIPMMIVYVSYIYCISALVGLLTKSTLAALIVSLLFWFGIFLVNQADVTLIQFKAFNQERLDTAEYRLHILEEKQLQQSGDGANGILDTVKQMVTSGFDEAAIERATEHRNAEQKSFDSLSRWHNRLIALKSVIPKTTETKQILERQLISMNEVENIIGARSTHAEDRFSVDDEGELVVDEFDWKFDPEADNIAKSAVKSEIRGRTILWVVGTSLGFEAFILAICCWVFSRRDY